MNPARRLCTAGVPALMLALVAVLAGCAGPAPTSTSVSPAAEFPTDVPQELKVRSPKDARGIAACDLLTAAQLTALGLDPATARPDARGLGQSCLWYYADRSTYASLGISTHPEATKLPGMYRLRHDDPGFQILEVGGHPALRLDRDPQRECGLSVAIADLQNLGVEGYFDRKHRPDQCAQSRRMAEMVLSNLPPLAEEPR